MVALFENGVTVATLGRAPRACRDAIEPTIGNFRIAVEQQHVAIAVKRHPSFTDATKPRLSAWTMSVTCFFSANERSHAEISRSGLASSITTISQGVSQRAARTLSMQRRVAASHGNRDNDVDQGGCAGKPLRCNEFYPNAG